MLSQFNCNCNCLLELSLATDSNCHGDIRQVYISPGDICPYQEYLCCYWPDFDHTFFYPSIFTLMRHSLGILILWEPRLAVIVYHFLVLVYIILMIYEESLLSPSTPSNPLSSPPPPPSCYQAGSPAWPALGSTPTSTGGSSSLSPASSSWMDSSQAISPAAHPCHTQSGLAWKDPLQSPGGTSSESHS